MRKLITILLSLVFASTAMAGGDWYGGVDNDWLNAANWGTGIPSSAEWAEIRGASWVTTHPIITTGQTAVCGVLRANPGWGGAGGYASVTVSGGTLDVSGEIYLGYDTVNNNPADLIVNSGTVNTGVGGSNGWLMVGVAASDGQLLLNGGTVNAGILGMPRWWSTGTGTGKVVIDGGLLNTSLIIMGGAGNSIEFTKNLADGGGMIVDTQDLNDVDFAAWQTTVAGLVSGNQIFTSASAIQVDYSSVGETRTTEIYSIIPEPMTIALLGFGGLLLRRRR